MTSRPQLRIKSVRRYISARFVSRILLLLVSWLWACSKELQRFVGLAATLTRICRRMSRGSISSILYIRITFHERGRHEDKLEVVSFRGGRVRAKFTLHCASFIGRYSFGLWPVNKARTPRNFTFQAISHLRLFTARIKLKSALHLANRRERERKRVVLLKIVIWKILIKY